MTTKSKAYLAWVAICIIWGTTYLVIRIGVQEMPPFLFSGFRWLIAGPTFLVFLKMRGIPLPTKKDLLPIAIVGILLIGLGNGLITFGEQWIPSGLTALLVILPTAARLIPEKKVKLGVELRRISFIFLNKYK